MNGEFHLPLHPILVHFPIALYFFELFLLWLWGRKNDESYRRFAFLSFKTGYLMMLGAMAAGYWDAGLKIPSPVRNHFFSALAVFAVFTVRGFLWLRMEKKAGWSRPVLVAGSLSGILIVALAAYLGGLLVYD